MFSGIIRDVGTLRATEAQGAGRRFTIRTGFPMAGEDAVGLGDSIAVNGVCLTAEVLHPDAFEVVLGHETLVRTTLGGLQPGDRLNLERALRASDRLDGHIVSGHVDGIGHVQSIETAQESIVLWVESPPELSRYIAEKGSITIDGVSLTVNELSGPAFRVNLIPFTADETILGAHTPGSAVNLEVDVVARYLERLVRPGLDLDKLREHGFA